MAFVSHRYVNHMMIHASGNCHGGRVALPNLHCTNRAAVPVTRGEQAHSAAVRLQSSHLNFGPFVVVAVVKLQDSLIAQTYGHDSLENNMKGRLIMRLSVYVDHLIVHANGKCYSAEVALHELTLHKLWLPGQLRMSWHMLLR